VKGRQFVGRQKPEPVANNTEADAPEFTDDELRAALKAIGEETRRRAFAAGLPVYYLKGAALLALHPDGTEEIIEQDYAAAAKTGDHE
jgi:hypothetical protein